MANDEGAEAAAGRGRGAETEGENEGRGWSARGDGKERASLGWNGTRCVARGRKGGWGADCRTWRRQAGHGARMEPGRLITDSLFPSGHGPVLSSKTAGPRYRGKFEFGFISSGMFVLRISPPGRGFSSLFCAPFAFVFFCKLVVHADN